MTPAEYPERTCREPVWNAMGMSYSCELVDLHPGPHANFSVKDSVTSRDAFEESHPDWREQIGANIDDV